MADFSIEAAPWSQLEAIWGNGIWGIYWISETTGAIVYLDTNGDVVARKTTDGGGSWSSASLAEDVDESLALSCWFDQQTPGDTGTKIHCAYTNDLNEDHIYNAFDISAGTWGTPVVVNGTLGASGVQSSNKTFITKTRNGNILIGSTTQSGTCHRASSPYTSWTSRANPSEAGANDMVLGCSVNTGDGADAGVIFWDVSADAISIKVYDDSANTWTETAIGSSMVENASWRQMSCTTRLSDGHVLLAAWNAFDLSTADLLTWDINPTTVSSVSVTAKTNVISDSNNSAMVSIFVDQVTDDVYVVYGNGTNPTTNLNIVYKKSTDDMATWGSQTAYSQDTEDDYRVLGFSAMNASAGRFQPAWFDDDDLEIYINLVNDIELLAGSGTTYTPVYTETVTLVDTVLKATTRTLADVATMVDSILKATTRTLTDVVTPVDTVLKATTRTLTDVVTPVDTVLKATTRNLSEAVVIVDNFERVWSHIQLLTETVTLVDSIIRTIERTLGEIVTVVDTFTGQKIVEVTLTETAVLVDTINKSISRTLSDVATLVDTVLKTPQRTLSEAVVLEDTFIGKITNRTLTETITLVDSIIRSVSRTLSDTATLVDTVLKSQQRTLSEVVTLVDTVIRSTGKVLTETVTLVDSIIRDISRTLTEVITPVDSIIKSTTRTLDEAITVTDTFANQVVSTFATLLESITVTDTISVAFDSIKVKFKEFVSTLAVKATGIVQRNNAPGGMTREVKPIGGTSLGDKPTGMIYDKDKPDGV